MVLVVAFSFIGAPIVMKAFKKSKYFSGFVCSETEISAEGECGLVCWVFSPPVP